jgi:hypothetical protein
MDFRDSDKDCDGSDHLLQAQMMSEHDFDTGNDFISSTSPILMEHTSTTQRILRWTINIVSKYRAAMATFFFILLALIIGVIFLLPVNHQQSSQTAEFAQCGNDTASALNAGCVYSFVPGAFVPPQCHDAELEDEFLHHRDWHWFYDALGQREIPIEEIKATGGPPIMYVPLDYHRVHCAYTWKKLHRAAKYQWPIDAHLWHYEHTRHCADGLAAPRDDFSETGLAQFGHIFSTCRWLWL